MELKFARYKVEGILELVLMKEGATDKDLDKLRWQTVAYADDVVSGRMDICQACKEIQDWFLATF